MLRESCTSMIESRLGREQEEEEEEEEEEQVAVEEKQEENKALKTVLQQTVRTAKNFRYMMTEEFKQMDI